MQAKPIRFVLGALLAAIGLFASSAAIAEIYPVKPIKLIVPFPPGGAADTIGRIYAEKLSQSLKQPVVIENKPGAGTAIAAEAAAKAQPDGYTLSLAPAAQLAILPNINKKLNYDPFKDFAPVSILGSVPYVIAASSETQIGSVRELVAAADKAPGKLSYSSCGSGTLCHLSGELFKSQTRTDILHVPYKGSAPAITALLAGEVDLAFDTLTVLAPHVSAGKVKGLAVSSKQRSPLLPGVPTAAEAGLLHYEVSSWFGIVAPAATPKPIIARLSAELSRIAASPEVKQRLAKHGVETAASTPESFARIIRSDYARWGKIVQSAGIKLD